MLCYTRAKLFQIDTIYSSSGEATACSLYRFAKVQSTRQDKHGSSPQEKAAFTAGHSQSKTNQKEEFQYRQPVYGSRSVVLRGVLIRLHQRTALRPGKKACIHSSRQAAFLARQ